MVHSRQTVRGRATTLRLSHRSRSAAKMHFKTLRIRASLMQLQRHHLQQAEVRCQGSWTASHGARKSTGTITAVGVIASSVPFAPRPATFSGHARHHHARRHPHGSYARRRLHRMCLGGAPPIRLHHRCTRNRHHHCNCRHHRIHHHHPSWSTNLRLARRICLAKWSPRLLRHHLLGKHQPPLRP